MSTGGGSAGSLNKITTGGTETQATGGTHQAGTTEQGLVFDTKTKQFLAEMMADSSFSKNAAVADAQAASSATMKRMLELNAPGIESNAKVAGGYNNTTQAMQEHDLAARTEAAGSSVILDNIAKYQAIKQGNISAATGAVGATTGRKTTTTADTSTLEQKSVNNREDLRGITTSAQGGTVICTQLYNDGLIPEEVYRADQRYVDAHFTASTINGYRFWAVPFVYAMRANKYVYAIGKYFGLRWCHHCAAHYIPTAQKNTFTKTAMWFGVPICFLLGSILPEVKYYKLWEGS